MCAHLVPHKREEKGTTKGITKLSAKSPHQIGHVLSSQEEGEKQAAPPIET
jgi:hypothetical protein